MKAYILSIMTANNKTVNHISTVQEIKFQLVVKSTKARQILAIAKGQTDCITLPWLLLHHSLDIILNFQSAVILGQFQWAINRVLCRASPNDYFF